MQTAIPRILSHLASDRTVRQRTAVIERIRAVVSGKDAGDVSSRAQMRHEVARLPREERRVFLRDAGLSVPSTDSLAPGTGLALKAELALPWNKLRALRRLGCKNQNSLLSNLYSGRWIKSWGVRLPGERQDKAIMRDWVPADITGEMAPLSFKA